jgi:hypothetical protein
MMHTGFERHINSSVARKFAGLLQRIDFGMSLAGMPMPAFSHHLAFAHDQAAHDGIGM